MKFFCHMKQLLRSLGLLLALAAPAAHAQTTPPVLNGQPTATPAPDLLPPADDNYLLGRSYRIETKAGTTFTGTVVSISLTSVEFDAQELGHIQLERAQVLRATLQGPIQARTKSGYYDIGNGNRLFFAPTGRGLRRGEGSLQDVDVYLLGVNYGITDNISLGGYMTLLPGVSPSNQLIVLTPKVSFPVHEKLHVGAGVLYLRVPDFDGTLDRSYGAGILYGCATYGSADDNVTLGLGYGFFNGEIGSTPILQVGGQKRVSRRVSLISENYIIADANAGMGGLYGVKFNWRRTSLGLGAAYVYIFGHNETETSSYYNYSTGQYTTTTRTYYQPGMGGSTYILPVYYDFTFRFGKTSR
jgi:hypothetical protein